MDQQKLNKTYKEIADCQTSQVDYIEKLRKLRYYEVTRAIRNSFGDLSVLASTNTQKEWLLDWLDSERMYEVGRVAAEAAKHSATSARRSLYSGIASVVLSAAALIVSIISLLHSGH